MRIGSRHQRPPPSAVPSSRLEHQQHGAVLDLLARRPPAPRRRRRRRARARGAPSSSPRARPGSGRPSTASPAAHADVEHDARHRAPRGRRRSRPRRRAPRSGGRRRTSTVPRGRLHVEPVAGAGDRVRSRAGRRSRRRCSSATSRWTRAAAARRPPSPTRRSEPSRARLGSAPSIASVAVGERDPLRRAAGRCASRWASWRSTGASARLSPCSHSARQRGDALELVVVEHQRRAAGRRAR